MLWIMGILALGVTGCLIRPLLRRNEESLAASKSGHPSSPQIAEYKRRLDDLERDVGRGLISEADAQIARAEIGRQLLREHESGEAAQDHVRARAQSSRFIAILGVALIPLIAFLIYLQTGNPGYKDQPLGERRQQQAQSIPGVQSQEPSSAQIEDLIKGLEARLATNPDEEGWALLARTYESLKQSSDAARAWQGLLALNPDHLDGLWFSGVYAAQSGRLDEARAHWLKLQSKFNQGTEDYDLIQQALETLNQ